MSKAVVVLSMHTMAQPWSAFHAQRTAEASSVERHEKVLPGAQSMMNAERQCLMQAAQHIWQDMLSGEALRTPSSLCRFLLLSYADLKLFRYYYW